jgi:2-methylcitrate dehydratase PrpD
VRVKRDAYTRARLPRLTRQLAEYLAGVRSNPLPVEVQERTKLHLLDTLAAMISGATLDAGRRAIDFVRLEGAAADATVIGGGFTATAADAAFANGMSGHADETDDSHPAGFHPGCGIVAAALAVAERGHAPGTILLRAIAAGYDTGSRAALAAMPRAVRQQGYSISSHAIGGTFGAAAAAATQLDLDVEQWCCVLSYAAQQAWGGRSYLRDAHHVEKAFVYGGRTARAGVMAATMVQRGFDAVADVFDGEFNYFDAIGFPPDRDALVDGLGQRWEIMRTNIKRYPVGSPILGVVEGLNRLLAAERIDASAVKRVELRMPGASAQVVNERDMPNVNAQHIAAIMLLDGGLGLAASHDYSRMGDERVLDLRRKIELTTSGGEPDTTVSVELLDGRSLVERVAPRRGEPVAEDVQRKALELIGPVVGDRPAAELIGEVMHMERLEDVQSIRPALLAIDAAHS